MIDATTAHFAELNRIVRKFRVLLSDEEKAQIRQAGEGYQGAMLKFVDALQEAATRHAAADEELLQIIAFCHILREGAESGVLINFLEDAPVAGEG